jgi:hypothetical protein
MQQATRQSPAHDKTDEPIKHVFPGLASCEFIEIDRRFYTPLTASGNSNAMLSIAQNALLLPHGRYRKDMLAISRNFTIQIGRAAACVGTSFTLVIGVACGLCSLDRVGDYFMNQRQYQSAIPIYAVMTAVTSALAPRHHRLADAWTNLGVCYERIGFRAEADKAQRVALDFRRQDEGDNTVASATAHGGIRP